MCADLSSLARQHGRLTLAFILDIAALESGRAARRETNLRTYRDTIIGLWDWDIVNDRVYSDPKVATYFGLNPADGRKGAPIERYTAAIHPDDVDAIRKRIEHAVNTGEEFSEEYRLVTAGGAVRWVFARGRVQKDSAGHAQRFPGAIIDITAQKALQDSAASLRKQ